MKRCLAQRSGDHSVPLTHPTSEDWGLPLPPTSDVSSTSAADLEPAAPEDSASPRRTMAIVFTCSVCETRAAKTFSKQAYDEGVVLIRCPGCQNLHLIADRIGWFEEGGTDVEAMLREKTDAVRRFDDTNVMDLTPEDIAGSGGVGP